jgi:hypothetical protein
MLLKAKGLPFRLNKAGALPVRLERSGKQLKQLLLGSVKA